MLIHIKNSQKAKKNSIKFHRQSICESILNILWNEGFINGYRVVSNNKTKIEIFLKYKPTGTPVINSIKFLSKPSRREYCSVKKIWQLDSNKTFIIFSTVKGLMTINGCKKNKIGGEPLIILN